MDRGFNVHGNKPVLKLNTMSKKTKSDISGTAQQGKSRLPAALKHVRAGITAVILSAILSGCGNYLAMRAMWITNVDLEEHGITLQFNNIPQGMWKKPIIRRFSRMLRVISDNTINIYAINAYTVGSFKKDKNRKYISGVSNFIDPYSRFKDTWFGVYLILDDTRGLGRRFMLKNSSGVPSDLDNLRVDSLLQLPAMDQKLIFWSSHSGQKGYTLKHLGQDFYFTKRKGSTVIRTLFTDPEEREWLNIYGEFDTISALTDISRTDMGLLNSIRAYTGLPNEEVYRHVPPWHPVTIKGIVRARYFPCANTGFWAVVYYNGCTFTMKNGRTIDTWANTDLQDVLEEIFGNMRITCRR